MPPTATEDAAPIAMAATNGVAYLVTWNFRHIANAAMRSRIERGVPAGDGYCFERGARKDTGGDGRADVWKRHPFTWEYKDKHADLDAAFNQLRQYALALENPPLLIVSDMARFRIRTNLTNSVSETHEFTLDDLFDAATRDKLKWAMSNPRRLQPRETAPDADRARPRPPSPRWRNRCASAATSRRRWGTSSTLPALTPKRHVDAAVTRALVDHLGQFGSQRLVIMDKAEKMNDVWLEDVEYRREYGSESSKLYMATALAAARKKAGITQTDLSDLAGVGHKGTFHKISPKHLQRYVDEFVEWHNFWHRDTMDQMGSFVMGMERESLMHKELIA